ncbi:hypothetical protein C4573_04690 [Candidatus Woesearchaeota archaeon]|nr:MAG: hypothetical protein C4573_04690 [Candidatus Woesearchaeota archaeon]
MKLWKLTLFVILGLVILGFLLFLYFFIFDGACGVDGCHDSCESKPCVYYKEIGDCRNTDYKYSQEYFKRMLFSGFSNANTASSCECVKSGIVMECQVAIP